MGDAISKPSKNPKKKENSIPEAWLSPPQGRYDPIRDFDYKVVRRKILKHVIAPFFRPKEFQESMSDEKCPICFQYYSGGLNECVSCKCRLCTECMMYCAPILKPNRSSRDDEDYNYLFKCPFCKVTPWQTIFTGPKTVKDSKKEMIEEQRVIELQIKRRNAEMETQKKREKEVAEQRKVQEAKRKEEEEKKKIRLEKLRKENEEKIANNKRNTASEDVEINVEEEDSSTKQSTDETGLTTNSSDTKKKTDDKTLNVSSSTQEEKIVISTAKINNQEERTPIAQATTPQNTVQTANMFVTPDGKRMTIEEMEIAMINLAIQRSLQE